MGAAAGVQAVMVELGMFLGGLAAGLGLGQWIGWRRGYRAGWYHGYAARMHESCEGENYR